MLQFSKFLWALSYAVWDVFNNFLLIDATDRSKISSDQKRFFIALNLYPLSFFANTPFKSYKEVNRFKVLIRNQIHFTFSYRAIIWKLDELKGHKVEPVIWPEYFLVLDWSEPTLVLKLFKYETNLKTIISHRSLRISGLLILQFLILILHFE